MTWTFRQIIEFRDEAAKIVPTAATESAAAALPEIAGEMLLARTSERPDRLIGQDESGSMEKTSEGYF